MKPLKKIILPIVLMFCIFSSQAQYFGKNKVVYEDFDFRIYETPHFEIYHYLDNEAEIRQFAQLCERWYARHQEIFRDTLPGKSPIILYNNHADFQQTTVIQQLISVGTGGVTEGIRQRVVMPVSPASAETNHVLGHEMVHVFQYNLMLNNDSLQGGRQNSRSMPLWMIEGLSEYLSIGSRHVQTALWMRDAVKHDNIPTMNEMTRDPQNYFPYRYGHAFWAYFAGVYGDDMILPLFYSTAMMGPEAAVDSLTRLPADSLSAEWAAELKETYQPFLEGRQASVGELLFDASNAGTTNIAPAISPDGEKMIFISDRNVFSIDFFLADVNQKEIAREITNIVRDARIDQYSYLESAGTWNPRGTRFALTAFMEGKNKLLIADLEDQQLENTITLGDLNAFNNPDWSPDGNSIVVSGLKQGNSNLFVYDLNTQQTTQLTHDEYDALHPQWSPDGRKILFITNQGPATDLELIRYGNYKLAEYDLETGNINVIDILPDANIVNPRYSPDGSQIFFVADADGFRNIYRYDIRSEQIRRLTNLQTGVIGISSISPCFDISRETGDLIYTLYNNSNFELHRINISDLEGPVFASREVDLTAAVLPPEDPWAPAFVDKNLKSYPLAEPQRFETEKFDPKFTLENIGSRGIGVGTSQFGTAMAGGVSLMFSDILRENTLVTALQVQGRIIDIAGQIAYVNQASRFNWGGIISHYPYRYARGGLRADTLQGQVVRNLVILEERVFESELGTFGIYPLSRQLRFEGGLSATMYNFRRDSINNYFSGNLLIDREEYELEAPETFYIYRAYLAYVGDGSLFGLTSPMEGYRYRFQADRTMGEFEFWGLTADYRRYFLIRPFSLGTRLMHYGRYGDDADEMQPIYLGNPYFVRGYSFRSLRQPQGVENYMPIENLTGSKVAIANIELRLPFTGPEEVALIRSRLFFSDLILFADGGLSWFSFENISMQWEPSQEQNVHTPVFSSGIALRLNLFGAVILEPYLAFPFQRRSDQTDPTFGFYLSAGGF